MSYLVKRNRISTGSPMSACVSTKPFTRQLRGKLREQRFHLGRQQTRITYYIATGRRIVLLTVFVKTRQREHLGAQREWRAMQTCIAECHTMEDDE